MFQGGERPASDGETPGCEGRTDRSVEIWQ